MRGSVVSRGFNISYRVEGQGASLLLLHGGSMWADTWWDAGHADELGGEFRVIAVDFLGHGDSDKPHDLADYHSDLMVSDVIAVLDAEQVERALVRDTRWEPRTRPGWRFASSAGSRRSCSVAKHPCQLRMIGQTG